MAIALVGHTKYVGNGTGGTTPAINTTGANFIVVGYTFYNGTDYPAITDSKGNIYYATARENAFSPALASELRFTKQVIVGAGHTWTIAPSGTYPGGLNAASLYVEVYSGVQAGADSNPNFFSPPWYNDGGNNVEAASSLACNPGSAGGTNGQVVIMLWGNSDPTNNTTVTATDGLGGTPAFTITDSDKAVLPLPGLNNYNAGLAYYIQPTATSLVITQSWADWVDLFPHNGPLGQAVMSAIVIEPSGASPPPSPGAGNRSCGGELGPVRSYTPAVYQAQGVHFDGNTWLSCPSLVNSDSSDFAFFCWYNASSAGSNWIWSADPTNFVNDLEVHPGGGHAPVHVELGTRTGSSQLRASNSPSPVTDSNWHSLLMSGSMNAAAGLKKFKIFRDGVDVTSITSDTSPAFAIALSGLPMFIGNSGQSLNPGDGAIFDLAIVWMANVNLIDGSGTIPPATLNKFVSAGKAQNPDGFPFPATLLFNGNANSFGRNLGSGGAFTLTGTLTNSSTNPP